MGKSDERQMDTPLYGVVDERTKAVAYQGDAYTGRFMLFAVLIDVVIRSFNFESAFFASNWDLMLIVIVGGMISTAYQVKSRILFNRPFAKSFLTIFAFMCFSAVVAMLAVFLIK